MRKLFMRIYKLSVPLVIMCLSFSGCFTHNESNPGEASSDLPPAQEDNVNFSNSGFKIRMTITSPRVKSDEALVFEIYVDKSGCGRGLLGFKDDVYDLIISEDKVYVRVENNLFIYLNEITGHMISSSISVNSETKLSDLGFEYVTGEVFKYNRTVGELSFDGVFQVNDDTFEHILISDDNPMTIEVFINTVSSADIQSPSEDVEDTGDDSNSTGEEDNDSYYVNSNTGIEVHGKVYSITDYCNTSTYFEGQTPEGIVPEYILREDSRVELLHISYISTDGKFKVATTDGYVQAISTTTSFNWLGLSSGMNREELERKLGINLKKGDADNYVPVIDGITAKKSKDNGYICEYGNLTIALKMDSATKTLCGITISNYLENV